MKLLVTGYGRHGKDTFCELTGMKFTSSSWEALERVIWPTWGKYRYNSLQECFDDRHTGDNRSVWFNMIQEYNTPDKARLAREILEDNYIYCGMRCKDELAACKKAGLFDATIWIDASDRRPPEGSGSMTITKEMCDIIVDNNGSERKLKENVDHVLRVIKENLK